MKKKFVKVLVCCSMLGIGFTALGTNTDATTYYGNGVYCNKQKCWVNWSKARSEIIDRGVKAYVNGFTKVLGDISGR